MLLIGIDKHFIMPAKPFLENWELPFVTLGEFSIPSTHGFATRAGIISSLQISMKGLAQLVNLLNAVYFNLTQFDEYVIAPVAQQSKEQF
jgi:hypothetical protein